VPFGLAQNCYAGKMRGESIKTQEWSIADPFEKTVPRALNRSFRRVVRRNCHPEIV
jgi:hypothetical protein